MQRVICILISILFLFINLPAGVFAQTTVEPYAYRYEEVEVNGEKVVMLVRYTLSEKKQKDEERIGQIMAEIGKYLPPGQQPQNVDPRAVAEWQYYWEQLKLWEEYIKQQVLGGEDLTKTVADINFVDPNAFDQQLLEIYNAHLQQTQAIMQKYYRDVIGLLNRIQQRISQREDYRDWIERNRQKLQEFASEWLRRFTGEEIEMEGKIYLVSPKPLTNIPPDKINIVTQRLTPYDLLNEDGTLKSLPAPTEEKEKTE